LKKDFSYLPQKPGFGVELDPAGLRRFAFSETEDLAIPQPVLRAS
jgi:hypothetical protein